MTTPTFPDRPDGTKSIGSGTAEHVSASQEGTGPESRSAAPHPKIDYAAIFRRCFDAAAIISPGPGDGTVLDANDAFLRLIGMKAEEVIGKTQADIGFWPEADARGRVMDALLNGESVRGLETKLRGCDGALRTVRYSAMPQCSADSALIVSFISPVEDLTRHVGGAEQKPDAGKPLHTETSLATLRGLKTEPAPAESARISFPAAGKFGSEPRPDLPVDDPVIDLKAFGALRAIENPEGAFLIGLIDLFLADMDERLRVMHDALERGHAEVLGRSAHALKGSCGHFGAKRLSALCKAVEQDVRSGEVRDQTAALYRELVAEAVRVKQALELQKAPVPAASSSGSPHQQN